MGIEIPDDASGLKSEYDAEKSEQWVSLSPFTSQFGVEGGNSLRNRLLAFVAWFVAFLLPLYVERGFT